jgi:DNA-binding MurR/RpiR family transcriptional regulator
MKQATISSPAADAEHRHQALCEYISARFDEFSRSQKDVAQYIVDHLDEAAFQTAEELARRANTSSSTVVRFSQALGFEGFPELQQAARDEYRQRPSGGSGPLFSLDHTDCEAMLATDHVNVEDTAQRLSRVQMSAAVDAIVGAESVLLVGVDQMAFFASYMRHLLMLLDVRAELAASPSQEALGRISRIGEHTLVVGLAAGRPHPLVTRTLKLARRRHAQTLSITDATLSDVARLAQIRLYYSSNSPAFVRSHTALLSLIQALAHGVYSRDAQQHEVRIKAYRLR